MLDPYVGNVIGGGQEGELLAPFARKNRRNSTNRVSARIFRPYIGQSMELHEQQVECLNGILSKYEGLHIYIWDEGGNGSPQLALKAGFEHVTPSGQRQSKGEELVQCIPANTAQPRPRGTEVHLLLAPPPATARRNNTHACRDPDVCHDRGYTLRLNRWLNGRAF